MRNWYIDISDWSNRLHQYSISLIGNHNIIQFNEELGLFKINPNEDKILKKILLNPVEAHLFWLGFCTGVEIYVKSLFLKQKLLPISNRNIIERFGHKKTEKIIFYSQTEKEEYFSDIFASVYDCCNRKVIAPKNKWLEKQLTENKIIYLFDINTPTLGWIYKEGIEKLFEQGLLTEEDSVFISKALQTLTNVRRNVESHIFLSGRTIGSIQKDRELIYIPMLNKLEKVYNHK